MHKRATLTYIKKKVQCSNICVCSYRHLLHAADLLHVDQGGEERGDILVDPGGPRLLLHGVLMGRVSCMVIVSVVMNGLRSRDRLFALPFVLPLLMQRQRDICKVLLLPVNYL